MRRAVAAALLVAVGSAGCVTVHHDERVERGPVLRAWERQVPVAGGGGVAASVEAKWPSLTLHFFRFEVCRNERVEEVVEERITEANAPSAGPSFAMGVSGTLIGGALLALRGRFSGQPNTRSIDPDGNYGPSPRQVATGWSAVLLTVGVAALVTGIVGLSQSGESSSQRKVEQVASALEVQCHQAPVEGEVQLVRASGTGPEVVTVPTQGGQVTLGAHQLEELRLASVHLDGALVLLEEEEAQELAAFLACNEALPLPAAEALSQLDEDALVERYRAAVQCEPVGGEAAAQAKNAYSEELGRRRGLSPQEPVTYEARAGRGQGDPPGFSATPGA